MQQKLDRAYKEGFEAGKKAEQFNIELKGYLNGCHTTWDIVEEILKITPGIGPKTEKRIMNAIKAFAEKEAARVEKQQSQAKNRKNIV